MTKLAIAMARAYVGHQIREPGDTFEVADDFPFGRAVKEAPRDHHEQHQLREEATKTLEFPQDAIRRQVKQRNIENAGAAWLETVNPEQSSAPFHGEPELAIGESVEQSDADTVREAMERAKRGEVETEEAIPPPQLKKKVAKKRAAKKKSSAKAGRSKNELD